MELELLRPYDHGGTASKGAHQKGGDPRLDGSLQGAIWESHDRAISTGVGACCRLGWGWVSSVS